MADQLERLQEALASRYRIERELGRGGMATVFLAEDLKHHRRVAIKVLHPELSAVLGPERFLREIEIAGRLQHPHILTLLDSGEARGFLYYVMPYVEGESLRERLNRERQLPMDEALRLTREVADALDYAHRQGVVHRDIKPENMLLEEGHAVLADFGIARAVREAGGSRLTETGSVLGTPAYMSPEQVMGGGELDGRSDVYSLACVLYEMLAGVPPFAGATGETLAHQHLSVEPPPITSARSAVPETTARALAKALAKTPADRFTTAAQFGEALAAPTQPAVTRIARPEARRRLLAIAAVSVATIALALVVWRAGPSLFSGRQTDPAKKSWILVAEFDGPAEDSVLVATTRDLVMAALDQSEIVATVPSEQVRVALQSAGKPVSTRVDAELARELAYRSAVRAVLEGRIGRLGNSYSIVLRLVDADSAKVLLSVSDAAKDQEALIPTMGRIVGKIRAELGERRAAIQATRPLNQVMTPSLEAYKKWVRASDLLSSGDNRGAITVARSALEFDPDFATAWGQIGIAFSNMGEPDSALEALGQALARRERLTETRRLLFEASVARVTGDHAEALAILERAVQLDPHYPSTHNNRGVYLAEAGRWAEALESYRLAAKVSPFAPSQAHLSNQLWALVRLGRLNDARQMVPRLNGVYRQGAPLTIATAAAEWAVMESVATELRDSPATDRDVRVGAHWGVATVQAARGQLKQSQQTLRRVQSEAESAHDALRANGARRGRLHLAVMTQGVAAELGDGGRWDSTTAGLVTRGLWAAAEGDTASARRLLATIRKRSAADLARQGIGPTLVEAWIAARADRWQDVVRMLGPAALQGQATGYVLLHFPPTIRWLVGEAYERLDRPDSAAAYFELAIAPPPVGVGSFPSRMAFSYGHRRLVLLYARMGRLEEARRHWETFSETFIRPDPELQPLVEEARAALVAAEAMGKSGAH